MNYLYKNMQQFFKIWLEIYIKNIKTNFNLKLLTKKYQLISCKKNYQDFLRYSNLGFRKQKKNKTIK